MENTEIKNNSEQQLYLSEIDLQNIKSAASWAQFFAILGFIGAGMAAIGGIVMFGLFTSGLIPKEEIPLKFISIIPIFYFLIGAIYFYISFLLFKSSVNLKNGVESRNSNFMTIGFHNLKAYYKTLGIIVIAYFALIPIIVFGVVIFAMMK